MAWITVPRAVVSNAYGRVMDDCPRYDYGRQEWVVGNDHAHVDTDNMSPDALLFCGAELDTCPGQPTAESLAEGDRIRARRHGEDLQISSAGVLKDGKVTVVYERQSLDEWWRTHPRGACQTDDDPEPCYRHGGPA